jgi:hypothetical protein
MIVLAILPVLTQAALVTKAAAGEKTQVNPMRKIIGMLQDMAKEIEREGEVEKEMFDKALCACEGGEKNLQVVIEESKAGIEQFSAAVKSGTAEKTQLEQEVKDHKASKAQAEKDLSDATVLRDKEYAQFGAEEKDNKANIASLGKAIPAIEEGMAGASLMQLPRMDNLRRFVEVTKYLTSDARSGVLAFLDQGSEFASSESVQAPQSGEILGILKSMKDEMEKDLSDLQAQEQKDFAGFSDLKSAKLAEIDINGKAVISKEQRIGALALSISETKHSLEDSEEELANAEKFLANMEEECANTVKARDMRAKMRAEEIKAISEAVGILNDDDALEVFKKTPAGAALVQKPIKTYDALLQVSKRVSLKSHIHREEPNTADAAEKMVTNMVDGMVAVLHDTDVSDEHKKDWCSNETETSHKIEADKEAFIQAKVAEIAEQEDSIATLTEEITGLTSKINELDKMVHEMTVQRKSEHQEFIDSFATSSTAIRLIKKAIQRLEKFYSPNKFAKEKKAAEDAALKKAGLALAQKPSALAVQRRAAALLPGGFDFDSLLQVGSTSMSRFRKELREGVDPVVIPETPGAVYEKKESGGVMALMNDFVTDLKTDMTESETEEKYAAKEYTRIMTDAKETRAGDIKSMNEKKSQKATLGEKLVDNKDQKQLAEEELHNLQLYLVQLHTECDFLVQHFDSRHENRVDQETGLEDAKTIVTDGEPPSHREVEKRYDEEHTEADVDEHFPGTPIAG